MKGRTLVPAGLVALTTAAAGDARAPRNGIVSFWTGTGTPAVWVMRPDGSGRRLVTRFKQPAKRGSFSPDGRLLVFDGTRTATGRREDFDVQVVRLDGTGRRWLTRAFREEDRVRSRRRRLLNARADADARRGRRVRHQLAGRPLRLSYLRPSRANVPGRRPQGRRGVCEL